MKDDGAAGEEQILLVVHKHWASLIPELLSALAPAFLFAGFLLVPRSAIGFGVHAFFALIVPFALLVIWVVIMLLWTNYYQHILIVSDRRIFYTEQVSLLSRMVLEQTIADLHHVSVQSRGLLQSYFKYGSILLEDSAGELLEVPDVRNPEYVAAVILKQDDRYKSLVDTTKQQEELLHYLSHEVKGHLAKSKAAFASIVEGDYGPIPPELGSLAQTALQDSQQGVNTVMSILSGSDFKMGVQHINKKPFDLTAAVRRAVGEARAGAVQKRLEMIADVDKFCAMVGDEEQIEKHVVRNLLDNAVHYTHAGRIGVTLRKQGNVAVLTVSDTGVGMTQEDMAHLFTQGGHGKNSKKINPDSTGYGLYIAKKLVEAHGGKIGAYSEGPDTGSTFRVELPLAK